MGLAPNQAFAADREDHAPAETFCMQMKSLIGIFSLIVLFGCNQKGDAQNMNLKKLSNGWFVGDVVEQ
jgi:HJR/Mrr/RecB family endonuclease